MGLERKTAPKAIAADVRPSRSAGRRSG